ncbi:MAG TPA: VOC family protein [Gaiellaceae bacterium]|nr:VOC family protein [Gaiellaceae bacterium]
MSLTGASPVLLVADLDRSVAFYRDLLGFECTLHGEPPNFAVAKRDDAIFLLSLAPAGAALVPHWHVVEMMWNAYVRLDNADAYYAEVQERGCPIDYSLYDAPHGFREFGVTDPDGYDIAFGQPLDV